MPSSNRSSGSSHYHRFIPSEEVQDVAAWEFAPVGDGSIEHKQPSRAGKNAEPEAPDAEQVEAIRQQARAEGFEQGRLAGAKETRDALEAQSKKQVQELGQRVIQIFQKSKNDQAVLDQEMADELLHLACDVARQVVRRELTQSVEPLKAVINEAMGFVVEDGRASVLRLNPTDLTLLLPAIAEQLSAMNVQAVGDESINPGGCRLESAHVEVDGTVERRWKKAIANLGLADPWLVEVTNNAQTET
jgi:flagellar assembly protein FliH